MTRDEENIFIKAKFRAWQIEWHRLFDADKTLADTEYAPDGSKISKDIDSDFRLIFGISAVAPETRRACFALFPKGEEMCQRFERFRAEQPKPLTETEARKCAAEMSEVIKGAKPSGSVNWPNVIVHDPGDPIAGEILGKTGRLSDLFRRRWKDPVPDGELVKVAAGLFLTEPFYMCAGNYYEPGDWIKGALKTPERDKVYELVYKLWNGGWYISVGEEAVVLKARQLNSWPVHL